uniref:Uncharacterized protein n=1 Tax=Anguilla anguilla TaxID=7936 RepID=A0A0E9V010_ANGAN
MRPSCSAVVQLLRSSPSYQIHSPA